MLNESIWTRISKEPGGCWRWLGPKDEKGYGLITISGRAGRTIRIHRLIYQELIGPVPDGLELDHLCRVRECCNPAHLEPVTHRENMRRSREATKTHCKHGHEFTAENTVAKDGTRICRACRRDRQIAYVVRQTGRVPQQRSPSTHCKRGHPLPGDGSRCRTCKNQYDRDRHRSGRGIPLDMPLMRTDPAAPTCRNGHLRTEETIYRKPNGEIICRICKNDEQRARRARLRQ